MDYFKLYDMPVQFFVPAKELQKKYYELSRTHHPDRQQNASEEELEEAVRRTAFINDAKSIFNNVDKTIAYILNMYGMLKDEKEETLPPSFLMEMMDYNEQIAGAEVKGKEGKTASIKKEIEALQENLYETIEPELSSFPSLVDEGEKRKALEKIRSYYFKKKYIVRLLSRV